MKKISNTLFLYTDASFNPRHKIAVSGWSLFNNLTEHELGQSLISKLQIFEEKTNIRAELKGAITALEFIMEFKKNETHSDLPQVQLFTDCQAVSDLLRRRKKLERDDFISATQDKKLSNSDLYQKFFLIYDKIVPIIHWIKGHSRDNNRNSIQKNFRMLDQSVRKKLRDSIAQLEASD